MYLRVARPTELLTGIAELYGRGLDLEVVASFEGHDGYDGMVLAPADRTWEIEFTREEGITAPRSPSPEHLLVIYEADQVLWKSRCDRMAEAGFAFVAPANPYWEERGCTFEDPEGYRVVIQNDVAPGQRAAVDPDNTSDTV